VRHYSFLKGDATVIKTRVNGYLKGTCVRKGKRLFHSSGRERAKTDPFLARGKRGNPKKGVGLFLSN